jgi:hypothetical protein
MPIAERSGAVVPITELETCAAFGCSAEPSARAPCCAEHWSTVPPAEQAAYFAAIEESLSAVDVQRARRDARGRIAVVLRGVKA